MGCGGVGSGGIAAFWNFIDIRLLGDRTVLVSCNILRWVETVARFLCGVLSWLPCAGEEVGSLQRRRDLPSQFFVGVKLLQS